MINFPVSECIEFITDAPNARFKVTQRLDATQHATRKPGNRGQMFTLNLKMTQRQAMRLQQFFYANGLNDTIKKFNIDLLMPTDTARITQIATYQPDSFNIAYTSPTGICQATMAIRIDKVIRERDIHPEFIDSIDVLACGECKSASGVASDFDRIMNSGVFG